MYRIVLPDSHVNERRYICDVLFKEFLGLEYTIEFNRHVSNNFIYCGEKYVELNDEFFAYPDEYWLKTESMPKDRGIFFFNSDFFSEYKGEDNLPIIFGNSDFQVMEKHLYVGLDILGSCFFMLSRYEEYVIKKRDKFDRFDYKDSIAYKNNFLDRPIVNEYIEILWCAIKSICSNAKRRQTNYTVLPTHDIDKPFGILYDSKWQIIRHFVGDILYKRGYKTSYKRLKNIFHRCYSPQYFIKQGNEVFDFVINLSRCYNLKNIFFFMNSKKTCLDGNYYVDYPDVKKLLEKVIAAGHTVGLHPSYDSYLNPKEIAKESAHISNVLRNIQNGRLVGGRQHYLRWNNPITWQAYESAGLKMDSTLTFAGHVGFRCGVCYPYTVYDVVNRKTLGIKEMPLIVMDGTLFEYMHLSHDQALKICEKLARKCRRYNGYFVFLWHNTMLYTEENRKFYRKLLESVIDG